MFGSFCNGLLCAMLLVGCGRMSETVSDTKVANGQTIPEEADPSVVAVGIYTRGETIICTGTFVNDSQLITAAHCLNGVDEPQQVFALKKNKVNGEGFTALARSVSFVRHPQFDPNKGIHRYDLAVLTFPPHTAPYTSSLMPAAAIPGQTGIVVGYGHSDPNAKLVKRIGSNRIEEVLFGLISFSAPVELSSHAAVGTQATVEAHGDSGAPLIFGNTLAGTAIGRKAMQEQDGSIRWHSIFVSLHSCSMRDFLSDALANYPFARCNEADALEEQARDRIAWSQSKALKTFRF